jgi:TolB-like protein/DNA-binding winged helix-turn-helix (wHTH) protein/Tfp pilus assembly protein PilF
MENAPLPSPRYRFGIFEVDPESGELRKQGRRVKLPDQGFQVLLALLERPGEVVTRQQLHQRLWPGDTFVDFDANLNTAMSLLREALGDSARTPRFIETLPRRGYRFLGAVADSRIPTPQLTSLPATPSMLPEAPAAPRRDRRPVGAVLLLAVIVLGGVAYRYLRAPARTVESVAVLPLVYAGPPGEGDQEYLADGITSALITELARLGVPNVISETSVMQYKGVRKPLPAIASDLGADVLVEGSVLREGSTVRVNAQLIDARTDKHIWAQSYQREMGSILELQSDIAKAIVREVRSTLVPSAPLPRAAPKSVNPAADEAYLRGRYALRNETEASLESARAFLEEAIRLEPTFAPAHAALAQYYISTYALPPDEARSRARDHARRALALDETLASAHRSLALASMTGDWDWAAAEREFKRSVDLDPSDGVTRQWYARFLDLVGRPRAALAQLQRLREQDPVSPGTYQALAYHHFLTRRYDEALTHVRKHEGLSPHDPGVFEGLVTLHVLKGEYGQAIKENERAIALWGREPMFVFGLAMVHARAGKDAEARSLLDELRDSARKRYVPPSWFGIIYMDLGDSARAFESLEKALDARDTYLMQLRVSPLFDTVRGDPRYQDLLRRMNLPPPEGT